MAQLQPLKELWNEQAHAQLTHLHNNAKNNMTEHDLNMTENKIYTISGELFG